MLLYVIIILKNLRNRVIIITLQDRTRTVCDSLHVGRHSLRGIDG